MNETMFVKPAPDLRVVDPATGNPLPEEGAAVPRNTYWLRRVQDQDVLEVPAPAAHGSTNAAAEMKQADGPAKTKSKREA